MKNMSQRLAMWICCFLLAHYACADSITVIDSMPSCDRPCDKDQRLLPAPLTELGLGAVKPQGWLKTQLDLMADGLTGHLPEISKFLKDDNGWFGGDNEGWEEAPYWFRGFYDLAYLTQKPELQPISKRWIEAVINSQDKDGYYGAAKHKKIVTRDGSKTIVDVWPNMVMNDALISHYQATGDERIIPMLIRFFAFCRDLPDGSFLPEVKNYRKVFGSSRPAIQMLRAGDFLPQLFWLYRHTHEPWLIDLAVKVYDRTEPAKNEWLDDHVVNFVQRFRYPAQMVPITGDRRYLRCTEYYYDQMMKTWGQMPRGVFAADERIRSGKVDPRQAFETCAMVESNKSFYILSRITGQTLYADRTEDMTFNHLPAALAPDLRSLRYLTACNMPTSVDKMDFRNVGKFPEFTACGHRCCQHNSAMGWPWFIKNMWQASPDKGLVTWLYGPSVVTANTGDANQKVTIKSDTIYPFDEIISMTLQTDQPVNFPLYLRIPRWCPRFNLIINDETRTFEKDNGKLIRVVRTWKNNDRIELRMQMPLSVTRWPRNGSVTVDRGPLSYSVRIRENWIRVDGKDDNWRHWLWKLEPASPWNYGLAIDPDNPQADIKVKKSKSIAGQPWSEPNAPIVLTVPAKKIPDWKCSIQNTVDPVREGPVKSDEPIETIEMIPMGCAHLRMTCLPLISDRIDARYWNDIPSP